MTQDQIIEEIDSDDTFSLDIESINNDGFEFPCVFRESGTCPAATADDIFLDGKLRPVYIQAKSDQLAKIVSKPPVKPLTRQSLSRLFTEDKDFDQPSCSSSETDELDGVSRNVTFCKWTPLKSNSTGTSRRWKFPSLLRRCHSENRDGLASYRHGKDNVPDQKCPGKVNTTVDHYPGKKEEKNEDRRKSYLPYKQDLIGLFANISNKPTTRKSEYTHTLTS